MERLHLIFDGLLALRKHLDYHGTSFDGGVSIIDQKTTNPVASELKEPVIKMLAMSDMLAENAMVVHDPMSVLNVSLWVNLQALMYCTSGTDFTPDQMLREVARMIVKGCYPAAMAGYAAGHYGEFRVHRLPMEGHSPIREALKSVREVYARIILKDVQSDPNRAIRSIRTGEVLKRIDFQQQHWNQLTWRFGYTTIYHLLTWIGDTAKGILNQAIDNHPEGENILPTIQSIIIDLNRFNRMRCEHLMATPELITILNAQ